VIRYNIQKHILRTKVFIYHHNTGTTTLRKALTIVPIRRMFFSPRAEMRILFVVAALPLKFVSGLVTTSNAGKPNHGFDGHRRFRFRHTIRESEGGKHNLRLILLLNVCCV
jgi:hypothetical protein